MMMVAKISCHGCLKTRSSSNRNRKYHSGRGSVWATAGLALSSYSAPSQPFCPAGGAALIGPAVACQTTAIATMISTTSRFTTTSWNMA